MNKDNRKEYFTVALVCFLLGLMLVAQFRGIQTSGGGITSLQRSQELTAELKKVLDERDLLRKEVIELRGRISEYEDAASKVSGLTEAMQKELEKVRITAGLLAVHGPGVVVTLDDSTLAKQGGEDANLFLVHDEDLLKVINELFAAGAEAISVNGQRIITTSEVRCVGPTVIVNSVRLAPPFVINAIGDADTLETSLKMRGGVVESLQIFGIQVNIKKQDNIEIPAYTGPIQYRYLKPVKAGDKS